MKIEINCQTCKKLFMAYANYVAKRSKKYCSWECYRLSKIGKKDIIKRSWRVSAEAKLHAHYGGNFAGKKHSVATRAKLSLNRKNKNKGAQHYNWQGGITTQNSAERIRFRRVVQPLVFARDSYTCQVCLVPGGCLQVDHIKPWADYPELRFDMDNCRTLCMACHYYVTFKRKMPIGIIWGHNLKRRIV